MTEKVLTGKGLTDGGAGSLPAESQQPVAFVGRLQSKHSQEVVFGGLYIKGR